MSKKKADGWALDLQPTRPKMDPKVLQAQIEATIKEEFHHKGGWIFDPTKFGFKLHKQNTKSMFDLGYMDNKVYYEAWKEQAAGGIIHRCKITRPAASEMGWGKNDYQFELTESHPVTISNSYHDRAPVTLDYTIPTLAVAQVIMADSADLAKWFDEVCTEPKVEPKPIGGTFNDWRDYYGDDRRRYDNFWERR